MKKDQLFLVLIVLAASILIISSHWDDTPTIDEVTHIGAGYSYLVQGNMRLNPEHPPLAKDVAAIPLVFMNINGGVFKNPYWQGDITPTSQSAVGKVLLYQPGNNADNIMRWSRLAMLLFFILPAILMFKWSYQLYGRVGAYTALGLFSFSPTVIAHSGLVTTDIPVLAGILFAAYFFIKYLRKRTTNNFVIASLVAGIALLTKFSALLLIPFFILLGVICGLSESGSSKYKFTELARLILVSLSIFVIAFVAVVWPIYLFHLSNYDSIQQNRDTQLRLRNSSYPELSKTLIWMSDKPLLRAISYYGVGLISTRQRTSTAEPIYFLGQLGPSGQKKYFPVVYSLKEPLPWLILITTSILIALWQLVRKRSKTQFVGMKLLIRDNFTELSMLLWIIIYWAVSINGRLNIGIRHLLPTYPFAIILVSGQLAKIPGYIKKSTGFQAKLFLVGIISLFGWYVFESLYAWPNYLSYFNQIAGWSGNGYRYVVDSNLDWGQDLKRFAKWVDNEDIAKIELNYFGLADEKYYLGDKFVYIDPTKYKNAQEFINENKSNGWIAVSATTLFQRSEKNYDWLKNIEPMAKIGNSIWVWHILDNSD